MQQHPPDVVLLYPSTGIDMPGTSVFAPLSVLLPAAALRRAGLTTEVIDMRVDRDWRRRLRDAARRRPSMLGVSAMTGAQIRHGLQAARIWRREAPDAAIVWGGVHATLLPEQTLEHQLVDAVVAGVGEEAIVELARELAAGRGGEALGRVHRFEPEGSGVRDERRVPGLDWEAYDWKSWVTPVVDDRRGLALVTSRGCPHRCGYCYNRSVNGSRWQGEPAGAVLEDLERIAALGERGVILFDDNFFVSRRRVETIARGLVDRGLRLAIKADCRADYLARYDDDFLELLARAGFSLLYIGAESGSDRMLEAMRKDATVEQLLEANRKLARAGIRPHYSFMAGLPGERIDDVRATIELMLRLKRENPRAYLSPIKGYVPYAGTDMFDRACSEGFEPPRELEGWRRFDWSSGEQPWLERDERRFVEKATYVSAGVDTAIAEIAGIGSRGLLGLGYRRWARLCRRRCERPDLGSVPELPLVRLFRRLATSA